MSYSERDIHEAFECATVRQPISVALTSIRVFSHLEGRCDCDIRRCPVCGARERNKYPVHKEGCTMKMKS